MAKYGLRPHTFEGKLFSLLSELGIGGLYVSELVKTPQVWLGRDYIY